MRGTIYHPDYEIEYFEYGQGPFDNVVSERSRTTQGKPRTMLAFHGFDNHAEDFKALAESLTNEYRIIAVNLFFHGESKVADHVIEKGFQPEDLKDLFDELAKKFSADKYTLAGYSMGGRIVLKLLEIYPERIDEIILIAPDGIKISPLYKFLTQSAFGMMLLKTVIDRPSIFFTTANFLKAIGFLPESKYKFVVGNFNTHAKREKVYSVWMVLRMIISRPKDLKKVLENNLIKTYLFFGKYDKVIPPSIGIKFQKEVKGNISLNILEAGHQLMKGDPIQKIAEILTAKKNDAGKKAAS